MSEKLYVVLPAYNEEDNIENVLESWYTVLDGKSEESRIVIADSGSKDKTHEILDRLRKEYPKIEVLRDTGIYHGEKVIALYDYAIRKGASWIFQTDSDGQTNPDEFADFWEMRNEYDGIFGSRTVRGDGKIRAFIEKIVCLLLKLYFGIKIPDANAPFRLMKADVVAKYLPLLDKNCNLPNIMMTACFSFYGNKLVFKEISFYPRQGGVNSINIPKIVKLGWKALDDFQNLKRKMKK